MTTIADTLAHLPAVSRMVVMIRHAERGPIDDPTGGLTVPITQRGARDAEELGRCFPPLPEIELRHSPVDRCRQTAEHLARGLASTGGRVHAVEPLAALGGPYLRHPRRALELARELDSAFLRAWFDGRVPEEIIEPAALAARAQAELLVAAMRRAGPASSVMVTHDWNVLLVRDQLLGLRYEESGWAGFLDGLVAYEEDGGIMLRYLTHQRRIG